MEFNKTEKLIYDMSTPIAGGFGFEVYDVEFVKEGGNRFLRIFLDKPGGISIDECETFSRALSDELDKSDPISQNYYLEVSSPGIERRIRRRAHFELNKGETVDVRLYKAVNGSKTLTGELLGIDEEDNVSLDIDGENIKIPYKQASAINVHFDF